MSQTNSHNEIQSVYVFLYYIYKYISMRMYKLLTCAIKKIIIIIILVQQKINENNCNEKSISSHFVKRRKKYKYPLEIL